MTKQIVLACCRHSLLNQPHASLMCWINYCNNKNNFFSSTAFPPQFLPGTNFLPGIKNSSPKEPSGSRLRITGLFYAVIRYWFLGSVYQPGLWSWSQSNFGWLQPDPKTFRWWSRSLKFGLHFHRPCLCFKLVMHIIQWFSNNTTK